jgi:hypothetical protein
MPSDYPSIGTQLAAWTMVFALFAACFFAFSRPVRRMIVIVLGPPLAIFAAYWLISLLAE